MRVTHRRRLAQLARTHTPDIPEVVTRERKTPVRCRTGVSVPEMDWVGLLVSDAIVDFLGLGLVLAERRQVQGI